MKLQSITINNMHKITKKTYELSNITYFYGTNGVGKSTILQAIQLAVLGYIPGYSKTNESIFKHSNSVSMSVCATFENSWYIRRTYQKIKSSVTCEVEENLPNGITSKELLGHLELPIFNFQELICQSANKLKSWFIEFLPKSQDAIDWNKILIIEDTNMPVDLSKFKKSVIEAFNFTSSGVNNVVDVHNYLKALLSAKTDENKRAIHTLQSLIYNEDVRDCEESIESVKLQIQQLTNDANIFNQKLANFHASQKYITQLNAYNDLCDTILQDPEYINIINTSKDLESQKFQIDIKRNEIYDLEVEASSIKKLLNTQGRCTYLNCDCIKLAGKLEELSRKYLEIGETIKKYRNECDDFDDKVRNLNTLRISIESRYQERDHIRSQINYADVELDPSDLSTIHQKIAEKQELLGKLLANQKYENMMETLQKVQIMREYEIQCLKCWIKCTDANHLQNDLMIAPFIQLSDKISFYVNKLFNDTHMKAQFNLSSKSNDFSFGVYKMDEDIYIPYDLLSSGEKCIFTLAFMLTLLEISNSTYQFLLIDDMLDHLDDDKIAHIFKSFESNISDIQLICAGVKPYSGDILSNTIKL